MLLTLDNGVIEFTLAIELLLSAWVPRLSPTTSKNTMTDTPVQAARSVGNSVEGFFSGLGSFFKHAQLAKAIAAAQTIAPVLEPVLNTLEPGAGTAIAGALTVAGAAESIEQAATNGTEAAEVTNTAEAVATALPEVEQAATVLAPKAAPALDPELARVAGIVQVAAPVVAEVLAPTPTPAAPVAATEQAVVVPTAAADTTGLLASLAADFETVGPIVGRIWNNLQSLAAAPAAE